MVTWTNQKLIGQFFFLNASCVWYGYKVSVWQAANRSEKKSYIWLRYTLPIAVWRLDQGARIPQQLACVTPVVQDFGGWLILLFFPEYLARLWRQYKQPQWKSKAAPFSSIRRALPHASDYLTQAMLYQDIVKLASIFCNASQIIFLPLALMTVLFLCTLRFCLYLAIEE